MEKKNRILDAVMGLCVADALGVPIALLDGCADPYSFKTVRASMGAVFRMDIPAITEAEPTSRPRTVDMQES